MSHNLFSVGILSVIACGCFGGLNQTNYYATHNLTHSTNSPKFCNITVTKKEVDTKTYAIILFLPPLAIPAKWVDGNWESKEYPYQLRLTNKGTDTAVVTYSFVDSLYKGIFTHELADSLFDNKSEITHLAIPPDDYRVIFSRIERIALAKVKQGDSCTDYIQLKPNSRITFRPITD